MNDETGNREYKRQLDRDDRFERAVVAFLNSRDGGTIYLGVEDDGTVCGVADPDLVQRQAADRIRNNVRPATMGLFDVGLEERDGRPVVRIVVSSGPDRPYYRKKDGMTPQGCFVRVGSQTQQIPEAEIEAMFSRRARTSLRTIPAPNQNLRFEQLRIRYEEHGKSLNERFKETLELLTPDGKYNLVAYLLADDNTVSIKVAKYAGTDKIDLVENEEYGFCSILRACDRVLEKLIVENTTSARIGRIYREERKRYDPAAVREAVVNAFVHNDWTNLDTPVFELFSDRLEVTSHGSLLPGMTREDLLSGCSRVRNRELMRVFRDVDLVEQLGSGMRRMLGAYPPDIFRYTETFFHVDFRFAEKSFSATLPDKGGLKKRAPSSATVEFRIQIFEFLAGRTITSASDIATHFGCARSAIMRHLAHLKAAGVARFIGSSRNGHWEVVHSDAITGLADRRDGENVSIRTRKVSVEDDGSASEKGSIGDKNGFIGHGEVSIGRIRESIGAAAFSRPTWRHIQLLARNLAASDSFRKADAARILPLQSAAVTRLLRKMLDKGVIVPVSGHGKGAYRFAQPHFLPR